MSRIGTRANGATDNVIDNVIDNVTVADRAAWHLVIPTVPGRRIDVFGVAYSNGDIGWTIDRYDAPDTLGYTAIVSLPVQGPVIVTSSSPWHHAEQAYVSASDWREAVAGGLQGSLAFVGKLGTLWEVIDATTNDWRMEYDAACELAAQPRMWRP